MGRGTMEVAKPGDALKDIFRQIIKATTEINQIAVASQEETAIINEIASAYGRSLRLCGNAKRIQQNAEASAKLANLAREINEMVRRFSS